MVEFLSTNIGVAGTRRRRGIAPTPFGKRRRRLVNACKGSLPAPAAMAERLR